MYRCEIECRKRGEPPAGALRRHRAGGVISSIEGVSTSVKFVARTTPSTRSPALTSLIAPSSRAQVYRNVQLFRGGLV